jgi:hypothetical protein
MRISIETVIGDLEAADFSTRVPPQILPRQFMVEGAVRSATPPASRHARGGRVTLAIA